MRPTEALMQQADLRQRLSTPLFRNIFVETVASMWGVEAVRAEPAADSAEAALAHGNTYLIEPNMVDLISHAAASLDDSDRLDIDMLPARSGVLVFSSPYVFTDIRGSQCKVHWMTWSLGDVHYLNAFGMEQSRRTMVATLWNDLSDPDDIATSILASQKKNPAFRQTVGRWSCVGALSIPDGQVLGPATRDMSEQDREVAERLDAEARRQHRDIPEVQEGSQVVSMPRVLWATVLLMQQEIVSERRSEHTKAETKVLRRNSAQEWLTVLTLRRRSNSEPTEGGSTEWSHRWLVSGHWAWRHCGESHPAAQPYEKGHRARVWVQPYIKGPEGKSFSDKKKVYRLSR